MDEKLRNDTLSIIRTSTSFRNRTVSYHCVNIGKVKGKDYFTGKEYPFEHLAIIIDNFYYYLIYLPNETKFQRGLLENVDLSDKKEIGITMFETEEIMFAGNYIIKKLEPSNQINKSLEFLVLTICDSLDSLTEAINGDRFIHQPIRIAESRTISNKRYCYII